MPQRWYDHWYSYGHHLLCVGMAWKIEDIPPGVATILQ
jgi:hypothetical protein